MNIPLLLAIIFCVAIGFYFIGKKVHSSETASKEALLQKSSELLKIQKKEMDDEHLRQREQLRLGQDELKCKELMLSEKERILSDRESALPSKSKEFVFSHALKILSHDYFKDTVISRHLANLSYPELLNDSCFVSATTEKRVMQYPLNVSAKIKGESGIYTVTLNSCTCPSFVHRHTPCKHMYQLALEMGILFYFKNRFWMDLKKREDEFASKSSVTLQRISAIEQKNSLDLEALRSERQLLSQQRKKLITEVSEEALNAFFSEKSQTYPWFAKVFSDYVYTLDGLRERDFKSIHSSKASEERKRLRAENRDLNFKNKLLEHQLSVYESVAPWLLDFKELSPEEVVSEMAAFSTDAEDVSHFSDYESLKNYLSEHEYNKLSDSEKYQLALDRWKTRRKSNWAAGIDYERYIGYLYELQNYKVKFQGALRGFDDMGIDVIASKGKTTLLIQCKRYSEHKTVHENTVFQLYGSYVFYKTQNPTKNFVPVIYTSAKLTDIAQKCADFLNIEVHSQHPLQDYPLVKCNISPNGEKIFHLPFDQQYDRVEIIPKRGEFYTNTVQEAADHGFRRAYRWHSSTNA